MIRQNIPIAEDWLIQGFDNWSAYAPYSDSLNFGMQSNDAGYPASLATQNHIDIRTFATSAENWAHTGAGTMTIGPQSSVNHWPGLKVVFGSSGTTTLTSDLPARPLNLLSILWPSTIVLALPNFPLANVDLNNSSMIISDALGGSESLLFSDSMTTLTSGSTALTVSLSNLLGGGIINSSLDPTQITTIQFQIATTGACTVTLMALRLVGPQWVQTNVDYDNFNGWLRQCIPLNGSTAAVPVANNLILPQLWRSANPSGIDDPRPIDTEIGFLFNTGANSAFNACSIFLRETQADFPSQQSLQGDAQSQLTGLPQPGPVPDPNSSASFVFKVVWGNVPYVQISNSTNPTTGYIYQGSLAPTLAASTTYLASCALTDSRARLIIYNVNQTTLAVGSVVFDTTEIPDTYMFKRYPGRIGIQTQFQDGDSYVADVRPRSLVFAEYQSSPLQSLTPVQGAQLFVNSSPASEYWSNWTTYASTATFPTVISDQSRFLSDGSPTLESTRIVIATPTGNQGVISNVLTLDDVSGITNFNETNISFALWFPSGNDGTLTAQLISDAGNVVNLNLPVLLTDQWQQISLTPPAGLLQAGLYQLLVYYTGPTGVTFWLDNISVAERTIRWSARSIVDDPWESNYAPWTNFNDLINSHTDGVYFTARGTELQIRGQALNQNAAVLTPPKVIPKYAELGRFAWPEDRINETVLPSLSGAPTATLVSGRTYRYTLPTITSASPVIGYQWVFGDGGAANGLAPRHTYQFAGNYLTTLTVTDLYGNAVSSSTIVGVT